MNEPVDIRTRQPLNRKELTAVDERSQEVLTAQEVAAQRQRLAASRLDAQFPETSQRIRSDLSRIARNRGVRAQPRVAGGCHYADRRSTPLARGVRASPWGRQ